MYNILYSLISLIIALFFILLGFIGILIPWSAHVRTSLVQFILENSLAISLFGFTFMIIGLATVVMIILNSRKRHYFIKSTSGTVAIDDQVIQQYLSVYWKQQFPAYDIPWRLTFKNNRVHIDVNLPALPLSEQKPLLERIRKDIRHQLAYYFAYQDEFYLTASFQK